MAPCKSLVVLLTIRMLNQNQFFQFFFSIHLFLYFSFFFFRYDQDLHLLESYFCPSLLQTGFTSTCLAQQPACDCDFTQPSCPNRLSPQCCADLLSELNGPLSSVDGHVCDAASFSVPAISLSAVNPIIRVAHQTSALGVFSSPTNGSSLRSFPTRTWSVYLDHPTACGFMALRA